MSSLLQYRSYITCVTGAHRDSNSCRTFLISPRSPSDKENVSNISANNIEEMCYSHWGFLFIYLRSRFVIRPVLFELCPVVFPVHCILQIKWLWWLGYGSGGLTIGKAIMSYTLVKILREKLSFNVKMTLK